MSSVLSRSRVSSEQLDLLLSFMEEHPDFAAGKLTVFSRFTSSKLWRLLAERLNAAAGESGGAYKSPDKWCRYWADIKYKARKKAGASGALGDLSTAEERIQNIFNNSGRDQSGGGGAGAGGGAAGAGGDSDDDGASSGSSRARLPADELLLEAAMRSALAAEKQAEAVAQAVELLHELLALLRPPAPPRL